MNAVQGDALTEVPAEIFVPDFVVADPEAQSGLVPDAYKAKVAELSVRFDLSPTLVTHPQLAQDAAVDPFGRLHLVGFFGTRPQAVRFSIFFQPVNGGWMIDEVAVAIVPTETVSIQ